MIKYETFDAYVESSLKRGQEMLVELRDIAKDVLPYYEESMSYGVPCFNLKPNAKLNDRIMIASFKTHIGFYPHPETIKHFKNRLTDYKLLKNTVQIKFTQEIPRNLIKEMIIFSYNRANEKESN